jgi:hypothetical protein
MPETLVLLGGLLDGTAIRRLVWPISARANAEIKMTV